MADSTNAHFLTQQRVGGAGLSALPGAAMDEEGQPSILWGQGTPNGDLAPFNLVNKGSLYLEVNGADDKGAVWQKVDEGSDNADWTIVGQDGGVVVVTGQLVDISAGDSEQVLFNAVVASEILEAGLLWNEASAADTGVNGGDATVGTATGGGEIVAATAYGVAAASGSYQALTLVDGTLAAGDSVFWSHDQAVGAGTYIPQMKIRLGG